MPRDTLHEAHNTLEQGEVKGLLLDAYVAGSQMKGLSHKLRVKEVIKLSKGVGVVLSGEAIKLQSRVRDYIRENAALITKIIQNSTTPLEVDVAFKYFCPPPRNQSINQSINQSTNQPTNQPINQSTNQPTNQPINRSISQYNDRSINGPASQSVNFILFIHSNYDISALKRNKITLTTIAFLHTK